MPHPRAKVHTQIPLPWDVLGMQMPRGGSGRMGILGFDSCITVYFGKCNYQCNTSTRNQTLRILVSMSYTYLAEDLFKFKEPGPWKSSPDEESTVT